MHVYPSSARLDPEQLIPGRDLVLKVDNAHGLDVALGVGALDHLSLDERRMVDQEARLTLDRWRERFDPVLTVEGITWPFVWEWELFAAVFLPLLTTALGLRAAIRTHHPTVVVWHGGDAPVARAVADVAAQLGARVATGGVLPADAIAATSRQPPLSRKLRQALFGAASGLGLPSRVRPGSVVLFSYWPLTPLLDTMLGDAAFRPALVTQARPAGWRRTLAAARQGGWLGLPGPRERRFARGRFDRALADCRRVAAGPDVCGLALDAALTAGAMALAARRGANDLATAIVWRRALRARPAAVIVPFETNAEGRLLVCVAREAGILSVVYQHGTFVIPTALVDMKLSDLAAVWSPRSARGDWRRAPLIVGSPFGGPAAPMRDLPVGRPLRVVVLAQSWEEGSALLDPRDVMRHYSAAIGAIRAELPGASIVLRPHPADPVEPVRALRSRFGDVGYDVRTELSALLAGCDLCVGASTTGTMQSALAGTPTVLLNVTGREWHWPLGEDSGIAIARSEPELASWLRRWRGGEMLPGVDDLLAGLGHGVAEGHAALLGVLAGRSQAVQSGCIVAQGISALPGDRVAPI